MPLAGKAELGNRAPTCQEAGLIIVENGIMGIASPRVMWGVAIIMT